MSNPRTSPAHSQSRKLSILLFGLIILDLSLRLDGWGNPDVTVSSQLLLLPFTLLFLLLFRLNCGGIPP